MKPPVYHSRVDLSSYDQYFAGVAERDYSRHDVSSPFDAWSIATLRAKCDLDEVEKIPADVFLWGRGYGGHECITRIGGLPAWTPRRPLPSAARPGLRFFGQFNLADSADVLPALPGRLLSVWGDEEFPWDDGGIQAFWLDPKIASLVDSVPAAVVMPSLPLEPFFGSLCRTWDPVLGQELPSVPVDHQFEAYRSYSPEPWMATKAGGVENLPQDGGEWFGTEFFLEFCSIQAAPIVPYPWTNRVSPLSLEFDQSGFYHQQNCVVLGDLGAISFGLRADGTVAARFACG